MNQAALIIYHKHFTSARTLFLRGPDGCLFYCDFAEGTAAHPGSLLKQVAQLLGISLSLLELESEFRHDDGEHPVYLARATPIDPPTLAGVDIYRFISILDARTLPQKQLDLLGAAYRTVLGG